jgi:hypothetical protein
MTIQEPDIQHSLAPTALRLSSPFPVLDAPPGTGHLIGSLCVECSRPSWTRASGKRSCDFDSLPTLARSASGHTGTFATRAGLN